MQISGRSSSSTHISNKQQSTPTGIPSSNIVSIHGGRLKLSWAQGLALGIFCCKYQADALSNKEYEGNTKEGHQAQRNSEQTLHQHRECCEGARSYLKGLHFELASETVGTEASSTSKDLPCFRIQEKTQACRHSLAAANAAHACHQHSYKKEVLTI
eukprot:scaffold143120_cov19-Tisochrysis_lutea.AAC.1